MWSEKLPLAFSVCTRTMIEERKRKKEKRSNLNVCHKNMFVRFSSLGALSSHSFYSYLQKIYQVNWESLPQFSYNWKVEKEVDISCSVIGFLAVYRWHRGDEWRDGGRGEKAMQCDSCVQNAFGLWSAETDRQSQSKSKNKQPTNQANEWTDT